jgi:hypothetical protein
MARCEMITATDRWPYAKRCDGDSVATITINDETLKLCADHSEEALEYVKSLKNG